MSDRDRPTSVEVLLATHNEEQFLVEQIDSLLAQSHADFTVIASDDHSSDRTCAILRDYANLHPGKFRLLDPAPERLGASRNFGRLLDAATADYVLFCDQDDVWLPEKIAASLVLMRQIEAEAGAGAPVLVHTDLTVVDEHLAELGASFMRYAGIEPARNTFAALLLGNIATGCTLLANRALYELARPVPAAAIMFDLWMAQVAAGCGRIAYLDQPTVLYRQHGRNAIGATKAGSVSGLWARIERVLLSNKTLTVFNSFSYHAEILLERFKDQLEWPKAHQARILAKIWDQPRLLRFVQLTGAGLRKPSVITNLGLFVLLLRNPRREGGK